MSKLNFEEDAQIDPMALDIEWLDHSNKALRYGRHEVKMERELDDAKMALDVVRAELDSDIRTDPEKFGLSKITEGAVQNVILLQKRFRVANERFLDAKREYGFARVANRTIIDHKYALENLVRLHGQLYFSGPKVPRDIGKEWEQKEKQKRSNEKIKIGKKE
jgi:hypothetical protein